MAVEKMHHKITHSIEMMMLNSKVNMPFYGDFLQQTNFYERRNDPSLQTAGVNVSAKGMNYYYNPEFLDSLTQEQVNFLNIHELFHLLFNHPKRTRNGGYDHKLSNIAQDMIINTIIASDIRPDFVDIPKNKDGRNSALFTPKEYDQEMIFEILYDWLKDRREEFDRKREKKEDEKIFAELYAKPNRPFAAEVKLGLQNVAGQLNVFNDTLTPESKTECQQYVRNFTRRVFLSIDNDQQVELFGHTSSIIPDGEAADYNDVLSQNRADLFKMAILNMIDDYVDMYSLAKTILDDEKTSLDQAKMIAFICKYEEITNKTMLAQREKDLLLMEASKDGNGTIDKTFSTYRFTQLNKLDEATLRSMIHTKQLQVPNMATVKLEYLQKGEQLLIATGKGFNEPIIVNDAIDGAAVLRKEIATLPQYKQFVNIKDADAKQALNRRVSYKFPGDSNGGMGGGDSPESENQGNRDGYGSNGKNGQECFDLDAIFDKSDSNDGQFFDQHMGDEIPEELREQMVKDAVERMKARGLMTADLENIINKLQKKRKDYLKEIKRGISQIKGFVKDKTISRPSRRQIMGAKGHRKYGAKLNVILDVSGSMTGYWEKALSYVFRNDIEINLIQIDTEVKATESIKTMKELQAVRIVGGGGTTMKLAFDLVVKKYNNLNTLLLTDGYTEALDMAEMKGKVLIISVGQESPIASRPRGGVKQVCVDGND